MFATKPIRLNFLCSVEEITRKRVTLFDASSGAERLGEALPHSHKAFGIAHHQLNEGRVLIPFQYFQFWFQTGKVLSIPWLASFTFSHNTLNETLYAF